MSLGMYKYVNDGKQYIIEAIGVRDLRSLTTGKHYETINGIEGGIFADSPYITLIDDDGNKQSMHAARFNIIKEKDSHE